MQTIEDVDKAEEDSDEDCHSARNTLRRNEKADPRDDNKHAGREVVGDDVVGHLSPQGQLKPCHRVVACKRQRSMVDYFR